MRRRRPDLLSGLVLYVALCAFLEWHVRRLQSPPLLLGDLAPVMALALLPALAARFLGRAAVTASIVVVALAGLGQATHAWPNPRHPVAYVERVQRVLGDGLHGWLNVTLPYSPDRYGEIRALVLLVMLGVLSTAAYGLLVRHRPLLVVAVALIPFATVSIVYDLERPLLRGVLFLAFALVLLASGDRNRRPRSRSVQAFALGTAVVVVAAVTASLPGVARGSLLPWRDWNLSTSAASVGVSYVWDQTYSGLHWPTKQTEVLRVASPAHSYWRAAVLDRFDGFRWHTGVVGTADSAFGGGALRDTSPDGPHTGAAIDVSFTVEGLDEPYLMSAGQPQSFSVPNEAGMAMLDADGVVHTTQTLPRGTTYRTSAVVLDPTPAQLKGAGTRYPATVVRSELQAFPDMTLPPFGAPSRDADVQRAFALTAANPEHAGWLNVYDRMRRAIDSQNLATPYDTVVALESYFRTNFSYDEHVALSTSNGPPLPRWILTGTAGYCQMFSGSMAEILRLLGIPARVAEGFTTGTYDTSQRVFRVTDHDAHAWVEVYFPGYGWLPFDPTPSRSLDTQTSTSSPRFAASKITIKRASDNIGADLGRQVPGDPAGKLRHRHGEDVAPRIGPATLPSPASHRAGSFVLYAVALAAAVLLLLLGAKHALRLWRLRAADPRAQAVACRADLAGYALDQRVELGAELTHRELGRRLQRQFGVDPDAWVAAADRARFAPEPVAVQAAGALRGETRQLRREMARTLTRRERAAGAVSLRSVVRG